MYHGELTNMLPTVSIKSVANLFGSQYIWPVVPYQLSNLGTITIQNFEYHGCTLPTQSVKQVAASLIWHPEFKTSWNYDHILNYSTTKLLQA